MTLALLCGALVGGGAYLLVRLLMRPAPTVRTTIARIDAGRSGYRSVTASAAGEHQLGGLDRLKDTLGRRLEAEAASRGWRFGRLRKDLGVMNRPFATMLATKTLFAVGALILVPMWWLIAAMGGIHLPGAAPFVVSVAAARR